MNKSKMLDDPHPCALQNRLAESWPARQWSDSHVVLAVSGGPDSVALLRAMAALKVAIGGNGKLYVAHLNHGVRGFAANEDEAWLKILCERLRISVEVGRTDVAAVAAAQGDGFEAAARTARYDFLRETAERLGARFVATGHTADDQVETVLHRVLRGTGLGGLSGIAQVRPLSPSIALVRPLLTVKRREIIEYLAAIGQDYRTDASNQNSCWTRNRLRQELLPELRSQYNPKVDDALARLAAQAREAMELISASVAELARNCLDVTAAGARIDCQTLIGQPPILVREVFRFAWRAAGWSEQSMGFDQWQQLASLARTTSSRSPLPKGEDFQGAVTLPGNVRAKRDGRYLVLSRQT
jgi:tRNA(Ile)-lysidine synthase